MAGRRILVALALAVSGPMDAGSAEDEADLAPLWADVPAVAEADAFEALVDAVYLPPLRQMVEQGYDGLADRHRDIPPEVLAEIRRDMDIAALRADLVAQVRSHLSEDHARAVTAFATSPVGRYYQTVSARLNRIAAEEVSAWQNRMQAGVARRLADAGLMSPPPRRPTADGSEGPEDDGAAAAKRSPPSPSDIPIERTDDRHQDFLVRNRIPDMLAVIKYRTFTLFRRAYPHVEEAFWTRMEANYPVEDCLRTIRNRLRTQMPADELDPVLDFMDSEAGRAYLAVHQQLGVATGRIADRHLHQEAMRIRTELDRRGHLPGPDDEPTSLAPPPPEISEPEEGGFDL